jgi:hypothetical protein
MGIKMIGTHATHAVFAYIGNNIVVGRNKFASIYFIVEIDINSFPRFRIYSTECPQGWYRYKDSCYKEFTGKKTW